VPTIRDGKLYGRGAADMKTSIAAMVVACEEFTAAHPDHKGSIAFLITSDEEGPATDGTVVVCELLEERGETIDYCLVGEPTSAHILGDMIKNGRRGSLSGHLSSRACRAISPTRSWRATRSTRPRRRWPNWRPSAGTKATNTTCRPRGRCPNIHAGTGANNVIPGQLTLDFNFRFSTASTAEGLEARVHAILDRHGLEYDLDWTLSGLPFLTPKGTLSDAVCAAIRRDRRAPNCRPPAAPRMAASSPASARR
jgi:succinyl-diaminopimelate desuccinylase